MESTCVKDVNIARIHPIYFSHIIGKHSASCVFFSPLFLPTFVASL